MAVLVSAHKGFMAGDLIGQCFKYFLILSAFWTRNLDVDAAVAKNSSPFDPFRLECPFFHGIVRLDLQRVESSEGVRSDNMVTSFCENIKKLFPSPRDPTLTTADEDCRWTDNFLIPGETFDFTDTCSGKEFVSGISRQAIGEYGILCCKVKDRKKRNCNTVEFKLPTVETPSVELETGKRILTGIGQNKGRLIAQFCDMEIMSRRELDEEFTANARARFLSQEAEDKGQEVAPAAVRPPATRAPSRLASPGIRPPAGFVQPRGRPGPSRQTTTASPSDEDDDGPEPATKSGDNGISRLAIVNSALSAPAFQNKGRPASPNRASVKAPTAIKATTTAESPDDSDYADEDSQTPSKVSSTKPLKAAAVGDETVAAKGDDIVPNPAHFQVLGIPRPVGSSPLLKPKVEVIRSSTDTDESDTGSLGGAISAGGSARSATKVPSLPPAPPVRHEITLPAIEPDDGETPYPTPTAPTDSQSESAEEQKPEDEKPENAKSESRKRENGKASSKKADDEKTEPENGDDEQGESERPASPVRNIGNLTAISNGVVINRQSAIESAVAPAKPLFTVLPPPPKVLFGAEGGKNPFPIALEEFTTPSITLSTTTGLQRLECHSNSAWRDPVSGLVVACGQDDEIWIPARCRPGLLCLTGKDSNYRLCCSVRVP